MADRLHIVEKKRKIKRMEMGFLEVPIESVEADSQKCPICHDRMGVANEDDIIEAPLRMVICCGQVLGATCLRTWLRELASHGSKGRESCPHCRYVLPESFVRKLYEGHERERGDQKVTAAQGTIELELESVFDSPPPSLPDSPSISSLVAPSPRPLHLGLGIILGDESEDSRGELLATTEAEGQATHSTNVGDDFEMEG